MYLAPNWVPNLLPHHVLSFFNSFKLNSSISSCPYTWNLSKLYTTGEVTLTSLAAIPGDFNNNGVVDAADYVVWRKGLGSTYTQSDYNVWRANFGQSAGSGAGASANAAVPEPATLLQMILVVAVVFMRRRRYAYRVSKLINT